MYKNLKIVKLSFKILEKLGEFEDFPSCREMLGRGK